MAFQLFTLVNSFGLKSYMPNVSQVDIFKKRKLKYVMHHSLPNYEMLNYLQVLNFDHL